MSPLAMRPLGINSNLKWEMDNFSRKCPIGPCANANRGIYFMIQMHCSYSQRRVKCGPGLWGRSVYSRRPRLVGLWPRLMYSVKTPVVYAYIYTGM